MPKENRFKAGTIVHVACTTYFVRRVTVAERASECSKDSVLGVCVATVDECLQLNKVFSAPMSCFTVVLLEHPVHSGAE